VDDILESLQLDPSSVKANMIYGICLCGVAKQKKSVKKIDKGINQLKKAISLCTQKNSRHYEKELRNRVRRAKKLKWFLERELKIEQNSKLFEKLKLEIQKKENDEETKLANLTELKRILLGDIDKSVDKHLIPKEFFCPLTKEIFNDPIVNQYGNSYERDKYMARIWNDKVDLISGKNLSNFDVYTNFNLIDAIDEYLEE
jgi:STIP1 family protein 1